MKIDPESMGEEEKSSYFKKVEFGKDRPDLNFKSIHTEDFFAKDFEKICYDLTLAYAKPIQEGEKIKELEDKLCELIIVAKDNLNMNPLRYFKIAMDGAFKAGNEIRKNITS